MKNRDGWLLAVPTLLVLSGCGTLAVEENVRSLSAARPAGTEFTDGLTREYRQFAESEKDEMFDWKDADYFARKGLQAAGGTVVVPERPENWSLSSADRATLRDARARLVEMLDSGGRTRAPARAALAQAKFDCWIEQQEEDHQPEHIAECRDAFWAALSDAEQLVQTGGAVSTELVGNSERIYFAFDSAKLTPTAKRALDEVASRVVSKSVSSIVIEGHADRAGPSFYNVALSKQRANAVRDYLLAAGVSYVDIVERPLGESAPIMQTADGVAEAVNRRAVIRVQP